MSQHNILENERVEDLLTDEQRFRKPTDLVPVMSSSPKHHRNAVYEMARCFMQELRHDFIPYAKPGTENDCEPTDVGDDHVRAFLWTTESSKRERSAIGACCFRLRGPTGQAYWRLEWIWIVPDRRRKGLLTKTWPFFKLTFGDFFPASPLSDSMIAFLRKYDPDIYS